jgi:hypothetical protein
LELAQAYLRCRQDACITKPNGQRITLPSDNQLFECIDGKYRESQGKVDRKVFEAFMESNPQEYTINALLAFARAKGAEPDSGEISPKG